MAQNLEALRQAAVIYPTIAILFTLPYLAWSYRRYGSDVQPANPDCLSFYIVYAMRVLPGDPAAAARRCGRPICMGTLCS